MGAGADFGYCRLCTKPLDGGVPECPHCGQKDPIDRFEDLEAGRVYEAEHLAPIVGDLHWFRLVHSGRRVFARISGACERGSRHRLQCRGFDGHYPSFLYVG